ncbi:MAG: UDP-N-acetylmuramoyl-L-alanyl-D-glutamate--2,6-diaminopimelate ligase [Hyphomicrobiaceae bacterium]|nr:UDP-N-acetylmuramoyl-L-alanyl-D-glutamate--2,6-diaminopimelate ligase [Hyphomicrobiaceae bacterium]
MKKLGQIANADLISGDENTQISGMTSDSRQVEPGFLFAALDGSVVDGAKFIPAAIEKGAVAILLHKDVDRSGIELPCIISDNPRRDLAIAAARFYAKQPATIIAVTGTNGKTSVASFVRQIWAATGERAASLGTVGIEIEGGERGGYEHWPLNHTTPDPVEIHQKLACLVDEGVTHLAIEASSHGLEQRRLEGLRLQAAGFTNITQDHLDYHGSMEAYFSQKLRLFEELLPAGAPVVVDADIAGADKVVAIAKARGLPVISVGRKGDTLKLENLVLAGYGQQLHVAHEGELVEIETGLIGDFQASNMLVAAGLCLASGLEWGKIWQVLGDIKGAKGRMEIVGETAAGVPVIVDYAHTPDALENAIKALKPIASGGRIIVVFGCGGDRDKGKRPLMGAIAQKYADVAYVTDDNPRTEDAATIRKEVLAAAPAAIEIGDRQQAINTAVAQLQDGDILLVAGKGHEEGQKVGDKILPFLDHDAVGKALALVRDIEGAK